VAKLYIFGIGGTGSRVIRSLTMLLAAGVPVANCDKVVPIIIDPDAQNGDMARTVELLKTYERLRKQLRLAPGEGDFFQTEIQTLASMAASENQPRDARVKETFVYNFGGMDESYRDFLHYDDMPVESRLLVDLLFTPANLQSKLTVGFKGSPNVGSVVLNQLVSSPEMEFFANSFAEGDRVFFISSIFGGTGAAGFPLLLKNLRNPRTSLPRAELLNNAPMGALSVLPYFNLLADDGSAIDSNAFITKTKAALAYYQKNLQKLNALYYLGDQSTGQLANHEGGSAQQNNAHFIELVGALSVLDFMRQDTDYLLNNQPLHYEYGLEEDVRQIDFKALDPAQSRRLVGPDLTRLQMLALWCRHHLPETEQATYANHLQLRRAWREENFYLDLQRFLQDPQFGFETWLRELSSTERQFTPFVLPATADLNKVVNGQFTETGFFNKGITRDFVRVKLDKALPSAVTGTDGPTAFIQAFSDVLRDVVTEKVPGF
jgi:hypothetical protein